MFPFTFKRFYVSLEICTRETNIVLKIYRYKSYVWCLLNHSQLCVDECLCVENRNTTLFTFRPLHNTRISYQWCCRYCLKHRLNFNRYNASIIFHLANRNTLEWWKCLSFLMLCTKETCETQRHLQKVSFIRRRQALSTYIFYIV